MVVEFGEWLLCGVGENKVLLGESVRNIVRRNAKICNDTTGTLISITKTAIKPIKLRPKI